MVEEHEMYPNAPIALVTVEITFPGEIGGPVPAGVQRAIGDVLGGDWVLDPFPIPSLTLNMGPTQPIRSPSPPIPSGVTILRYTDRERGTAVALTAGSVSLETTRYKNWPWFRSTLTTVVETVEKLLHPDGVLRAGVRYIDEVRVDGVERAAGGIGWHRRCSRRPSS